MTDTLSRRDFLAAAGSSLVIAVQLPGLSRMPGMPQAGGDVYAPSVYLEITTDGWTTVWVQKAEMGQGVRTSLPMIIAEELDADWSKVRVVGADLDAKYGDFSTGGSSSVSSMWEPLRKAGAQARSTLVAVAAARWNVAPSECRTENSVVLHPASGRRLGYGELVADAAKRSAVEEPTLKPAHEFRIVGKSVPRTGTASKTNGSARYGLDTAIPGMRYAVIARCPAFGGSMKGYDAAAAKRVPGVLDIVEVPAGVAVIAENTWSAIEGRNALACTWDDPVTTRWSSEQISRLLHSRAEQTGALARNDGDVERALAKAATPRMLDVTYEVPYLAHATMEPMNCVADVRNGKVELWTGNQWPDGAFGAQAQVAEALHVDVGDVTIHLTLLGGGFGRRLISDYVVEAAEVSKAAKVPVKLMWTREDDMQHDWYRPASVHRMRGAVDAKGQPVAWMHRVAAQSISEQHWPGSATSRGGMDDGAVDGAADLEYGFPNFRVEYCMLKTPVPVSWWRSVYASQTAFANECFVDELAHAAGRDPLEFRQALLAGKPRYLAVLKLAAEKAAWGRKTPGRGMGLAIHHFFSDAIVAEVAEVSVGKNGAVRVHRVVCAVDCGTMVHPDGVAAQIESGVVYGLSAALKGEITVEEGRIKQSNFHDYPVLRMNEMPEIEVHVVPSDAAPMGVGEPAVPPIAPAVANAVFALTGTRVRSLPIRV